MITPLLEKLILEGKAFHGTFVHTGRSSRLQLPENSRIIVHHLQVQHFADTEGTETTNFDAMTAKALHQLRVGSDKTNSYFIIRSNIDFQLSLEDPDAPQKYICNGVWELDTFLTHESDVFFEFTRAPKISGWVETFNQIPGRIPNVSPPNGYGNDSNGGIATQDQLDFGVAPANLVRFRGSQGGSDFGQVQSFNLNWGVSPITALTPINTASPAGIYSFPITTVSYVLIQGIQKGHFNPSI